MSYGLILGGNSTGSKCVFKLQKRAIRIIMGAKNNDSCREFFKVPKILPLSAQYIYSLLRRSTIIMQQRLHERFSMLRYSLLPALLNEMTVL